MWCNKVGFKTGAINQGVEGVKTITGGDPWEHTHRRSLDTQNNVCQRSKVSYSIKKLIWYGYVISIEWIVDRPSLIQFLEELEGLSNWSNKLKQKPFCTRIRFKLST